MSRRVWRNVGLSTRRERPPLDEDGVEPIGPDPARLGDHAHHLLHERREVEAVHLRGLAPLLDEHQLGHGDRLEQAGEQAVDQRGGRVGLVFLDVDPHLLAVRRPSARSCRAAGASRRRSTPVRSDRWPGCSRCRCPSPGCWSRTWPSDGPSAAPPPCPRALPWRASRGGRGTGRAGPGVPLRDGRSRHRPRSRTSCWRRSGPCGHGRR